MVNFGFHWIRLGLGMLETFERKLINNNQQSIECSFLVFIACHSFRMPWGYVFLPFRITLVLMIFFYLQIV